MATYQVTVDVSDTYPKTYAEVVLAKFAACLGQGRVMVTPLPPGLPPGRDVEIAFRIRHAIEQMVALEEEERARVVVAAGS
jgi:hypothetical protein